MPIAKLSKREFHEHHLSVHDDLFKVTLKHGLMWHRSFLHAFFAIPKSLWTNHIVCVFRGKFGIRFQVWTWKLEHMIRSKWKIHIKKPTQAARCMPSARGSTCMENQSVQPAKCGVFYGAIWFSVQCCVIRPHTTHQHFKHSSSSPTVPTVNLQRIWRRSNIAKQVYTFIVL